MNLSAQPTSSSVNEHLVSEGTEVPVGKAFLEWIVFITPMRRAWDGTDQVTGSGQRRDARALLGCIPSIDKQET